MSNQDKFKIIKKNFSPSFFNSIPNCKIATWNVRTASDTIKMKAILNEAILNNINILCLQETRSATSGPSAKDHFKDLGDEYHWVQSNYKNTGRGVAIGIRKILLELSTLKIIAYDDPKSQERGRVLFIEFDDPRGNHWVVGNIYMPANNPKTRIEFMKTLPWSLFKYASFIGMDSNLVLQLDEYVSSAAAQPASLQKDCIFLKEKMIENNLICLSDLMRDRDQEIEPTWFKKTGIDVVCEKQIDRILMSTKHSSFITNIDVWNFDHYGSDHRPVVASFVVLNTKKTIKSRAQTDYLKTDLILKTKIQTHIDEVLFEDCDDKPKRFSNLMIYIEKQLREHHKSIIKTRKKKYKKSIHRKIQMKLSIIRKRTNQHLPVTRLERQLKTLIKKRKENYFETKKKIINEIQSKKLKATSNNDDEYFKMFKTHNHTIIPGVAMDDSMKIISSKHSDIEEKSILFWKKTMNSKLRVEKESKQYKDCNEYVFKSIEKHEKAAEVNANLSCADLMIAVTKMKTNAPGPYRLDLTIFTELKGLIEEIAEIWKQRKSKGLPAEWSNAWIKLLFKGGNPYDPSKYRPVSLLCISYKIVSKAIEMKLAKILDEIIEPEQKGFVKGRQLRDAVASMLCAADNAKQCDTPLAMLSWDVIKAYDHLNREYLFNVMRKMGFSDDFVEDIELLHKNNTASLILNGKLSKSFEVTSGIRQGCALSVLLYTIALNPLFKMAKQLKELNGFKPQKFGEFKNHKNAPKLDNVIIKGCQFVDDVICFVTNPRDIQFWHALWKIFGNVSGQQINPDKTTTFLINKFEVKDLQMMPPQLRATIERSVVKKNQFKRVLGFHVDDKMKISNVTWDKAVSGVYRNVRRWKDLNIPIHSRAKMINAQILAGIYFRAQVVFVPTALNSPVHQMIFRELLQNNRRRIVNFNTCAAPLHMGGLTKKGIGLLQHNTNARLAKVAADMINKQDNLSIVDRWTWQLAEFELFRLTGAKQTILNGLPRKIAEKSNNPRVHQRSALTMMKMHVKGWPESMEYDEIASQNLFCNPFALGLTYTWNEQLMRKGETMKHLLEMKPQDTNANEKGLLKADTMKIVKVLKKGKNWENFKKNDQVWCQHATSPFYEQVGIVISSDPRGVLVHFHCISRGFENFLKSNQSETKVVQ